ncbi:hypothetical protein QGN29_00540 [Temperatibacter marinus]|uniref:DUF1007 family protein n=1 Tax=Temperatibacter marinus TaxID=1456591 RepID=A0AA52EFQ1_9PROT|nr:DUF6702 family protein [Temperatibacter marinus]WND02848.1 hypothetical protein QGN29_00540 [Temperatibacter marinus]
MTSFKVFINGLVAVLTAASLSFGAAHAHRLKTCVTTLVWEQDGVMQVTHKVHFHDAQRVLARMAENKSETLFTELGIARMALYMNEDFEVTVADLKVTFTPLGGEVDGDYLYIYLESDKPITGHRFTVKSDIFRKDFSTQYNKVIGKRGDLEKAASFGKKNQVETVDFSL